MRLILLSALAAAALVPTASAQTPSNVHTAQTAAGETLVDAKGMTLYTFDKDPAGKSVCNGECAVKWPPLAAPAGDDAMGDGWSTITRDDGMKQLAYQGKPLYLWIKDKKPGDTTGDNVGQVWHVAHP